MKHFFLLLTAACSLSFSTVAEAALGTNNYGRRHTCDSCSSSCFACSDFKEADLCEVTGGARWWATSLSCGSPTSCVKYIKHGRNTANNKMCCEDVYICDAQGNPLADDVVAEMMSAKLNEGLADVFAPGQSATYWGYKDGNNRSPSAGRGNSAHAKLDACLFYSDVDNLGTGYTGWDTCRNSTTLGCNAANKNEYCMDGGASVCEDRCDCVFTGFATCDGL